LDTTGGTGSSGDGEEAKPTEQCEEGGGGGSFLGRSRTRRTLCFLLFVWIFVFRRVGFSSPTGAEEEGGRKGRMKGGKGNGADSMGGVQPHTQTQRKRTKGRKEGKKEGRKEGRLQEPPRREGDGGNAQSVRRVEAQGGRRIRGAAHS
jgi:hypothetical protein